MTKSLEISTPGAFSLGELREFIASARDFPDDAAVHLWGGDSDERCGDDVIRVEVDTDDMSPAEPQTTGWYDEATGLTSGPIAT